MKKRILLTIIAIISFALYIEKAEANTCTTETNINCNSAEECDKDKNWEYKCSYTSLDGTMKTQIYYNNCLVKVFLNNKDVTDGWSNYQNAYTSYSKVENEITHDDIKEIVTKSNACPALLYSTYSLSYKPAMSVSISTTTLDVEKSIIDNINDFLSNLTDSGKTTYYVIDDYFEDPQKYKERIPYYKKEIAKCTYRQFTTGFFFGPTTHDSQIYDNNTYVKGYEYLGTIHEKLPDGQGVFEQKNKFCVGDEVEIMKPNGENVVTKVLSMEDEKGQKVDSCPHPGQRIRLRVECELQEYDIIRKEKEVNEDECEGGSPCHS